MSVAAIREQFLEGRARLPGMAETEAVRQAALARFGELGLPGRRLETWHYTDLTKLAERDFDFAAAEPTAELLEQAARAVAALDLSDAAPRCVFLDGHWLPSLSSSLLVSDTNSGLFVSDTNSASAELVSDTSTYQLSTLHDQARQILSSPPDEPALAALNTALASAGALLRIAGSPAEPIQLVFLLGRAGVAAQIRLRFELAPGSRATAVQHFAALEPAAESWLNLVVDIDQSEDSALELCRLQCLGADQILTSLTRARLASRARFASASIELGGKLVRNETEIALGGRAAEAGVLGVALTRGRQHCDTRIAIDHRAAETRSRQNFRAIADDLSRSIFNGKVSVQQDAQHIDARQRNDNLLLAPTAEIDTKPELEIYADQVACSHGATVGELSEAHLFYLRSRGIDAGRARAILTTAFVDVILQELPANAFREQARAAVSRALPGFIESD